MDPSLEERAWCPNPPFRGADRLAAAVLTGCQGGRCVRTHYFSPAHDTALGDVVRRVVVGVPNEAAPATDERRLRAPVLLVDPRAAVALLRGVRGVDLHDHHPGLPGFVGEEPAELGERLGAQRGPLGLAKPYPVADSRQLLVGDPASGAFSLGHDALGDPVVDVGGEPGLLAAAFLEQPPRGGGLLGLQTLSEALLPCAVAVQVRSGHPVTVGCGRCVDDSRVDPEESVHGVLPRCFGAVGDGVRRPRPVAARRRRSPGNTSSSGGIPTSGPPREPDGPGSVPPGNTRSGFRRLEFG